MYPVLAVCFVFIGCCSNVYFLELLVSEYPGSGNIVTFSQFLFIALEGFVFTSKFGTEKAVVPFSYYVSMVSMFFIVQVINNLAFNFNISMPLHMIFRSGSLAATLLLGIIILKRKYNLSKYISVGLISSGIIFCTIASAKQVISDDTANKRTCSHCREIPTDEENLCCNMAPEFCMSLWPELEQFWLEPGVLVIANNIKK